MFKHQFRLLILAILFFVSSSSYADVSDESIDKILLLSGLTKQVGQFPGLVKGGIEQARQQGDSIPDSELILMIKSVDESFLPSDILNEIKESLKKSISENDAKILLAWYESELGKEITRAEESASTPEAYEKMMQSAQTLLANTERVEFANRLDVLLGATDMAMDIQKNSGIAVYSAIMSATQPDKPLNIEQFKQQMDAQSNQTRAAVKQMVTISFVYSYQNIETEKLNKYEKFLNDPVTMKFNKAVIDSMNKGLGSSVSKWADALSKIFINKRVKS